MKRLRPLYKGLGIIMSKYDQPKTKKFSCDFYEGITIPATDQLLTIPEVEKLLGLGWTQPLMDFHDKASSPLVLAEIARKQYKAEEYWMFCQ